MSNASFRMMKWTMSIIDIFYPYIDKRVKNFGITEGITLVDYGCGPGRYTTRFAKLVGDKGKVYAVDVQPLAVEAVKKKIQRLHLTNVEPVLANGYNSGLPDHVADRVAAIDMFFSVRDPNIFLKELHRITKPDGVLIIDDGHETEKPRRTRFLPPSAGRLLRRRQTT